MIPLCNGTHFPSLALDYRGCGSGAPLDLSRPGTPADNAVAEAFNGSL